MSLLSRIEKGNKDDDEVHSPDGGDENTQEEIVTPEKGSRFLDFLRQISNSLLSTISTTLFSLPLRFWIISMLSILIAVISTTLVLTNIDVIAQAFDSGRNVALFIASGAALFILSMLVVAARSERDLVEDRLGRELDDNYESFLGFDGWENQADEKGSKALDTLNNILEDREIAAAKRTRRKLNQANLRVTVLEYFWLKIMFTGLSVTVYNALFPQNIIVTSIVGAVVYILPDLIITALAKERLRRFDAQFPYALELWISSARSNQTPSQCMEAITQIELDPVALEFKRALIDMQLGNDIDEALNNIYERIPSHFLKFTMDAIRVYDSDVAPLDELLADISEHVRKLRELRHKNGYLVYVHDLMSPLVVGIIFIQSQILQKHFEPITGRGLHEWMAVVPYGLLAIAILLIGESGKQLGRVEKEYQLPQYRSLPVKTFIQVIRAVSLLLFVYFHLTTPMGPYLLWAWFLIICLETPYAIIPIWIGLIIIASQITWQIPSDILQIDNQPLSRLPLVGIIAFWGWVLLIIVMFSSYRRNTERDPIADRLAEYGDSEIPSIRQVELSLSFFERWIGPFFNFVSNALSQITPLVLVENLEMKTRAAGLGEGVAASILLERIVWGVCFSLVTALLIPISSLNTFVFALIAGITASYIPVLYLNIRIRNYHQHIHREFPDLIILLQMRSRGGMSTISSFKNIFQHWDLITGNKLAKAARRTQLGMQEELAIKDLGVEIGQHDFRYLSAALLNLNGNNDSLQEFISEFRKQVYLDQEVEIRQAINRYQIWHTFSCRFLLLLGIGLWFIAPLINL